MNTWDTYNSLEGVKLANQYDSVDVDTLNSWMLPFLSGKNTLLDIGSGTGRDALWFSKHGMKVTCVEPSEVMREKIIDNNNSYKIDLIDSHLPDISAVKQLSNKFDIVTLMAVWMHIDPKNRKTAFENILDVLNPNGLIMMTLRFGKPDKNRVMYPIAKNEMSSLVTQFSVKIIYNDTSSDLLSRNHIKWGKIVIQK
jgi:SAM-dependent methyltransferase